MCSILGSFVDLVNSIWCVLFAMRSGGKGGQLCWIALMLSSTASSQSRSSWSVGTSRTSDSATWGSLSDSSGICIYGRFSMAVLHQAILIGLALLDRICNHLGGHGCSREPEAAVA